MSENKERAAAAASALEHYAKVKKDMEYENDMSRLSDLLTDLMHFCNRNASREDCPMDFANALLLAEIHFQEEK